jgi:hypothetical protein
MLTETTSEINNPVLRLAVYALMLDIANRIEATALDLAQQIDQTESPFVIDRHAKTILSMMGDLLDQAGGNADLRTMDEYHLQYFLGVGVTIGDNGKQKLATDDDYLPVREMSENILQLTQDK